MSAQDAWKRALNHREFWCVKAARRVARTVSLNPRRSPAPNLRTRIPIPTILGKPAQNDRDQTGSAIQSSSIHIGFHDARPVCMASSCADLAGRRHQFTLQAYAQRKCRPPRRSFSARRWSTRQNARHIPCSESALSRSSFWMV